MTNQEILFFIFTFLILNLIALFEVKKFPLKLKVIIFILSCILYLPILLASLFVIALGDIDCSCKFLDMNCLKYKPDDLKFDICMIIINVSFIIILAVNFIHVLVVFIKNRINRKNKCL